MRQSIFAVLFFIPVFCFSQVDSFKVGNTWYYTYQTDLTQARYFSPVKKDCGYTDTCLFTDYDKNDVCDPVNCTTLYVQSVHYNWIDVQKKYFQYGYTNNPLMGTKALVNKCRITFFDGKIVPVERISEAHVIQMGNISYRIINDSLKVVEDSMWTHSIWIDSLKK